MSKRIAPKLTRIQRDAVTGVTTVTNLDAVTLAFERVRNCIESQGVRLAVADYPRFAELLAEWVRGMQRGDVK